MTPRQLTALAEAAEQCRGGKWGHELAALDDLLTVIDDILKDVPRGTCLRCGVEFLRTDKRRRKFCSDRHRWAYLQAQRRAK